GLQLGLGMLQVATPVPTPKYGAMFLAYPPMVSSGVKRRIAPWLLTAPARPLLELSPGIRTISPPDLMTKAPSTVSGDGAGVPDSRLTLPRIHVHQIAGRFLMNGGRDGQEGVGAEPTVHGRLQAGSGAACGVDWRQPGSETTGHSRLELVELDPVESCRQAQ